MLALAAEEMLGDEPERILALASDSFYLDRVILPHTSLEHNGLLREMQQRNIESVTFRNPISGPDLFDLAAFAAGARDDLPAEGTVRLNEQPVAATLDDSTLAQLRRSYAGGLDALRSVSHSVAAEGACDLASIMQAVEGFLAPSLEHASATLLLSTVKSHDEYTFYHSLNTCILSVSLGRMLGLSDVQLMMIGAGAALHDIGKTGVPPSVLNHPGRLSQEQWREMKLHPQEGAQAILAAGGPGAEVAATIAFEHHMRFDGQGYPDRSRTGRPHAFSRLVTVVDIYDAMTTRRPYRRAYTPSQALDILLDGAGDSLDPDMVRAFVRMMGVYPPGSLLQMDGGEILIVTKHSADDPGLIGGVLVQDGSGAAIEAEPMSTQMDLIAGQLLPSEVGIDPASVLQGAGVELELLG